MLMLLGYNSIVYICLFFFFNLFNIFFNTVDDIPVNTDITENMLVDGCDLDNVSIDLRNNDSSVQGAFNNFRIYSYLNIFIIINVLNQYTLTIPEYFAFFFCLPNILLIKYNLLITLIFAFYSR